MNGNTEVGIETRFKNMKYPLLVNASEIKDLKKMIVSEEGFDIGTGYTWTQVVDLLNNLLSKMDVFFNFIIIGGQKKRNSLYSE